MRLGEEGEGAGRGLGVVEHPGLLQEVEEGVGRVASEADPLALGQQGGPVARPVDEVEELAQHLAGGVGEHSRVLGDGAELQGVRVPPAAGEGGLEGEAHGGVPSDRFRTADGSMPGRGAAVRRVVHRYGAMTG